jgi:hypothetical protein
MSLGLEHAAEDADAAASGGGNQVNRVGSLLEASDSVARRGEPVFRQTFITGDDSGRVLFRGP